MTKERPREDTVRRLPIGKPRREAPGEIKTLTLDLGLPAQTARK